MDDKIKNKIQAMEDELGHYPKTDEGGDNVLFPENADCPFIWILPEDIAAMTACGAADGKAGCMDMEKLHAVMHRGHLSPPTQIGDTCQVGWLCLMH